MYPNTATSLRGDVSFPEAVRDNVVSNDVTIMSLLRGDVIILGINFPFS